MEVVSLSSTYDPEFVAQVEEESGQNLKLCYQCGNCTAGCPYTFIYDIPVHRIMRLVQTGQKETVLKARSLWLCATCESCTTRCPNNIDVAKIMDVLRHIARKEGYVTEQQVKLFTDSFLQSVERNGRVFELGLMMAYNTRSGRPLTDSDLGPKILPKGKISMRPHSIKGKDKVAVIFQRFREQCPECMHMESSFLDPYIKQGKEAVNNIRQRFTGDQAK